MYIIDIVVPGYQNHIRAFLARNGCVEAIPTLMWFWYMVLEALGLCARWHSQSRSARQWALPTRVGRPCIAPGAAIGNPMGKVGGGFPAYTSRVAECAPGTANRDLNSYSRLSMSR